ncbi:39S ribosomal protein L55, mitochondrial-like isoform X1 [Sinocyclocheilus anshuiensis]|uniref:39S ribosomal protein L55, mitochondrial-like n=1 Tax=Sinocyclocheilus anshuiensis TaxID=1608454 RepID=A0A671Q8T7_9TELE|nr:PREDICTED: 39S ribosomal protein L55, mitochondrial-like isoform X1 [Sinocyclocheilus anshuiensis]
MVMALNTIGQPCMSIFRCLQAVVTHRCLQATSTFHTTVFQSNSNRTCVVRFGRQKYESMYPVLLVRPDGSTINIRYKEPRRIMKMPMDITTLSEEERKIRMRKREPKRTAKQKLNDFEDDFKVDDYSKFWKKK